MPPFIFFVTLIMLAGLTAACQSGTSRPTSSARWASTVCSSQADVVTLQAGPSKDDQTTFGQWKRGDGTRTYALPQRVQTLQKVYVEANNSPQGRETEMCVKFDNRPKKRMAFSKGEGHTVDANDNDDTRCRC